MAGQDQELILLKTDFSKDAYQREETTERTVFAKRIPLYSGEFHNAAASGYELQYILQVHTFEYENEKAARYNGQEFDIYRTFQRSDDYTELYLSTKRRR